MIVLDVRKWLKAAAEEREELIFQARLSRETVRKADAFLSSCEEYGYLNRKKSEKLVNDEEYMNQIGSIEGSLKRNAKAIKKSGELDKVVKAYPGIKDTLALYIELAH